MKTLIILIFAIMIVYLLYKFTMDDIQQYYYNSTLDYEKDDNEAYIHNSIETERDREAALSVLLKTGNFTRIEAEEYLNKYDDDEKFWVYNKDNNNIDIYFNSLAFGTLLG